MISIYIYVFRLYMSINSISSIKIQLNTKIMWNVDDIFYITFIFGYIQIYRNYQYICI